MGNLGQDDFDCKERLLCIKKLFLVRSEKMEIAFIVGDAPPSPSKVSVPGGGCQEPSEPDASFTPSLHEDRMCVFYLKPCRESSGLM